MKIKPRHIQTDLSFSDLDNKQCCDTIKGWLHCLTSELMMQISFSLIKKLKIGRPDHSLTPHRLRPITSYFCLTPPHFPSPLKVDVICVSPLNGLASSISNGCNIRKPYLLHSSSRI